MSWYNDEQQNSFIDATQEFTGGGGVSTSISEVQNAEDLVITETTPDTEETTTIGNVLLPAVLNEEEGTFDLYIRNVNQGGRIFFTTRGDDEQVKIEDGRIWGYYNYNPIISAVTFSKWIDITDDTVRARQGADNALAAAVTAGGVASDANIKSSSALTLAGSAQSQATFATGLATTANQTSTSVAGNLARINWRNASLRDEFANIGNTNINNLRNTILTQGERSIQGMAQASRTLTRLGITAGRLGRFQLFASIVGAYVGAGITAGVIAGIAYLFDYLQQRDKRETLQQFVRLLEEDTQNGANLGTTQDVLDISGLQIVSATNGGFTTPGTYQVDIGNNAELQIVISQAGIATITEVLGGGSSYTIGQTISISESDLGGGSGDLDINITSLITEKSFIENQLLLIANEIEDTDNRIRRRQNIPNTSSFSSDGFDIINIPVSEPDLGETTLEPAISLKVDTTQFQYDATGNLQIKSSVLTPAADPLQFTTDANTGNLQIINYDKIAEIGDDTAGAETGLYEYVLDKISETLGNEETYDTDGNVVVPATNIYQNINNIYELVMVGDQTFQNNNDYKLNLGYKTIWNDYHYDLITIALKAVRAGIFDSSFYNNDWLGYFPSLTRISDDEYMTPVKDVNVEILNNLTFKKGLVYFKQDDPLVDYNLNRKFEFICFIRPQDVDNAGVEYTLLQTGIRLPSTEYDLDAYKLKLGFRDNKFEITHNVRREIEYYASLTYKNYENTPPVFYPTTYINNQTTGETSRQSIYYDVERYYGVIDQQTHAPFFDWTIMLRRTINGNFSYAINFGISMYDMNFNTLKSMANPATDTWASPKIIYKEPLTIQQPRNGVAKIVVAFEYFVAPSQGNTLQLKTFTSVADIDQNLEFKWRINLKKVGDPAIYGSRIYDFNQFQYHSSYNPTDPQHLGFYVQTLWLPHQTYPLSATDTYNYIELELVHRGGATFAPLPVGSQSYNFYNGQHSIRLHAVNFVDYDVSPDTFVDNAITTFQDTADFIPTPIDANKWYKVVAELDLPNKVVQYWVDGVNNYFTFDTINNIPHSSLQLPQSDPTIPYFYSADFEFTNQSYTSLVIDNDIIVIGNEPSQGELQYTHFAWKHYQDPLDNYMTQAERDKLDILINYNYYYETVKVDRYLKVKEFYADVLDARKILINGGFAYGELSPGDQINQLKSADQSSDNVAITNAFVNIDKLFVSDPIASGNGFLTYNASTKEFTIGSSTISSADVENAVGSLVKISPSTYGFIFNQTDPLDKFLQIDDVYINNLVNLVIQNELVLTNAFTDATYGDVLIQVKDASAYSPYNLRELDDTDVRYNYKINGNHQYLYRELNQEIQYDPLLGTSYGDLYPVVMYHFQGEIINNARDWLTGIPASDYDFEMLTQGGQVVYGSAPLNMKNFNGVEGGNTQIRTKNVMAISSADRSCISFFHKPFGTNVDGTDDHRLVEFVDVNNYPVFYIKLEYVSNTAVYKLVFVNPANIADETEYTFNNSENEIYFGNENCILLWCDQPYWHFYINGKYHGVSINQTYNYGGSGIRDCKILIDLNYYNNRSLLYELKVYPKLLFKTVSSGNLSSTDLTFNNKVVVDITEMIRIITFTSGGFIIKELSGVQETKSRSIQTKVRSLDTSRRVTSVETKLPTTGTGTKGFIYSDGVSENYNLENPLDLTAVSTTALSLDDRKILTFKEIPNGADFDIKILSRSITSTSQARKLTDFSYLGITPLTIYDDPHPPYEYTFLLSYIETQMQSQGYFFQFETDNVGQPTTGSSGISFIMEVLGGDIVKYQGQNGVWALYREKNSVYTLIQTFNDGDEFLVDNYKYRLDALYMRKNNDPNTQIRIFINAPAIFADKFEVGQEFYMNSSLSSQHTTEPIRNWSYISSSSRKKYNHIFTDTAGTIRPLFETPGDKVNTTNGMPANEDTFFKWSWGINYTQIACLMESGDLLLNGDLYVNCPTNAPFDLNNGILVNQINNLVSPNRSAITGIPALVEQVYYMELTSWDRTNFIAYFTGTDRINTYTNQVVTQFEMYYDDTIEISVSASVLSDIQTYQYHGIGLATPSYSIGFNANNIVSHKFLKTFGANPYVDVSFGFNYALSQMNRITIPINLQDIVDYSNEAFLTTDEFILKYKPHTNTFIWEENIGMALDIGAQETAIPVGSFKAKTSTTQISSRRTLASAVPIEKISQKTKYQVFNTEVEINGNQLLESVNSDIANLFTIYTNEEKTDANGIPAFKDKASITLKDTTKEWVFLREPESEDILTATTKFIHNTTTLLTLKHNQVDCGVELKVGTIKFADNTTLTTSADLNALLNDISTTNPSYIEFAKNLKLPNGDIISAGPLNGTNGVDGVDGVDGNNGLGFTGGSYNSSTGIVTFASNDGLGFSTTDLRGSDGIDGIDGIDGTNGVDGVDGTNGINGTDGLGFTGGSYNSSTGIVTFASNDGLGFSTGDLRATYTDADARSAVYPISQTNSGLPIVNAGINIYDNGVWFNSVDGRNRINFTTDGSTTIRTPLIDGNRISLQHGADDRFYTGHTRNTSVVDLEIGDGSTNPAQIFLRGLNSNTLSSAIIFGDSGTATNQGYYFQGMAIYYDSSANKLKFTGDNDANGILDQSPAITINRTNRYVGILNDNPSVPLEVNGALTATGTIRSTAGFRFPDATIQTTAVSLSQFSAVATSGNYNDLTNRPSLQPVATTGSYGSLYNIPSFGAVAYNNDYNSLFNLPSLQPVATTGSYTSLYNIPTFSAVATSGNYNDLSNTPTIPTIPTYLFTPSYLKVYFLKGVNGRLSQNLEPGMQGTFFSTGTIPFNVGGYTVSQNTITIPADGVYEISYCAIIRSENSGSDRKVPVSYVRINNADPNGEYQAVSSCYLREHDQTEKREGGLSSSTILDLNQNDLVSIWFYREGNTGQLNIQHGHFQIKRIA